MEKPRRGRPPKEASESLSVRLDLRISQDERDNYERAAENAGVKMSAWIRQRLAKAYTKELRLNGEKGS